jgi:hypothetical protein
LRRAHSRPSPVPNSPAWRLPLKRHRLNQSAAFYIASVNLAGERWPACSFLILFSSHSREGSSALVSSRPSRFANLYSPVLLLPRWRIIHQILRCCYEAKVIRLRSTHRVCGLSTRTATHTECGRVPDTFHLGAILSILRFWRVKKSITYVFPTRRSIPTPPASTIFLSGSRAWSRHADLLFAQDGTLRVLL